MITKRNEFTHRLLVDAGVKEGMRVLDVGCGSGEVTMLAASLAGKKGRVVGVDSNTHALEAAEKLREENKLDNITYLSADIHNLPASIGSFDAIIGRRVLMYQPDAVKCLKKLLPHLKNSGLIVFQESDSVNSGYSVHPMPLHAHIQSLTWKTVEKEGGDIHMGLNLYPAFKKAGLLHIQVRSEGILQTEDTGNDLAWLIKMMLPRITSLGIASEDDIDIDTLEQRLDEEQKASGSALIRDMAFGAWANIAK